MKYFESKTDSGVIQINDSYKNLYLSRKVAIAQSSSGSGNLQADEFLVGIGNGTNSIDGCVINRPGGYDYHLNASSTQAFLYFFSNAPKSLGSCGLQVFNEKGEIIFDSNAKQAVVLACGGEGTSAYGDQLVICCGGDTIEADNCNDASQYITTLGPWTRYKTETTYEQKWVEYQEYVIENEYVNGQLTPVGHWVTKKRLDYVPVTKQVLEYYYTYSRTSTVSWDYEKYYYNLCLKNGVASRHTHRVDIDSDSKTWTDNFGETVPSTNSAVALLNAVGKTAGMQPGHNRSQNTVRAYSCVILDARFL